MDLVMDCDGHGEAGTVELSSVSSDQGLGIMGPEVTVGVNVGTANVEISTKADLDTPQETLPAVDDAIVEEAIQNNRRASYPSILWVLNALADNTVLEFFQSGTDSTLDSLGFKKDLMLNCMLTGVALGFIKLMS